MKIIYEENRERYEAISTWAEKGIISAAGGWRWDPMVKRWYTGQVAAAAKLGCYADPGARERLGGAIAEAQQEEEQSKVLAVKSRATDAEIEIPCPEGLAYLGYQKAGVAFALNHFGFDIDSLKPGTGRKEDRGSTGARVDGNKNPALEGGQSPSLGVLIADEMG